MSDTTERARRALTEETVGGIERFHSGGAMPGGRFVRERDYDALAAELAAAEKRANDFRIEADCALRDCDGMELDLGLAREALEQIAAKRPNQTFDPWAVEVARAALAASEGKP